MLVVWAEMAKNLRSIRQDAPPSQLKARSDCCSNQSSSPPEFVHVLIMTWRLARTVEVFVKLKKPFERKSWHVPILLVSGTKPTESDAMMANRRSRCLRPFRSAGVPRLDGQPSRAAIFVEAERYVPAGRGDVSGRHLAGAAVLDNADRDVTGIEHHR